MRAAVVPSASATALTCCRRRRVGEIARRRRATRRGVDEPCEEVAILQQLFACKRSPRRNGRDPPQGLAAAGALAGTSTSRSTFEALRHEEGARPAAISTLSRKTPTGWATRSARDRRQARLAEQPPRRLPPPATTGRSAPSSSRRRQAAGGGGGDAALRLALDGAARDVQAAAGRLQAHRPRAFERAGARAEKAALLAASLAPAPQRRSGSRPTSRRSRTTASRRSCCTTRRSSRPSSCRASPAPRRTATIPGRLPAASGPECRQRLYPRNAKIITHKPTRPSLSIVPPS